MKPKEGHYDLVSPSTLAVGFLLYDFFLDSCLSCQGVIDARFSRPLVKEDDAEREKRRVSVEKQKSVKDTEEKKKKRKNLER